MEPSHHLFGKKNVLSSFNIYGTRTWHEALNHKMSFAAGKTLDIGDRRDVKWVTGFMRTELGGESSSGRVLVKVVTHTLMGLPGKPGPPVINCLSVTIQLQPQTPICHWRGPKSKMGF
jgi:hypothetical protein